MRLYLRDFREQKGLTMLQMSKILDVSESYYCQIENKERKKNMDLQLASKIATALSMPINEIVKNEIGE